MQTIKEALSGIVQRVTFHNDENGWSVLKLQPFDSPSSQETVIVHQTKVFAGATMEFRGAWIQHQKFGRQFRADEAVEKKPASMAALEKYLGSGLIKGVGPKTAKKIVKYFQKETLSVFEQDISRLLEVPGIAKRKLTAIETAWTEHCAIREVMIFLQDHGISTLFAVRIFKEYRDKSINNVMEDPYRLAKDFYGIGFFSADKVALSLGFSEDSPKRMMAAIRHVLAASRDSGHCYLTEQQISVDVTKLLEHDFSHTVPAYLVNMEKDNQLRTRHLQNSEGVMEKCYYSKTLYYDEDKVASIIRQHRKPIGIDEDRVTRWVSHYCKSKSLTLSDQQQLAVKQIAGQNFSVLTGGPGCGKTTTVLVIVKLLEAMKKRVVLAAPTGRAAQRMSEVIGRESKTLHRLLEWKNNGFQKNEEQPLSADFIVIDECSMLDISLCASLLKAIKNTCQILFIGDADQLPSVGAGNVLHDIIRSGGVPVFRLTQVFRQAQASKIIQHAHKINQGQIPYIDSPFHRPELWTQNCDCLFIDSEEITLEQSRFIAKITRHFNTERSIQENPYKFNSDTPLTSYYDDELVIPTKFQHVNLDNLSKLSRETEQLKSILKKVHPWSSLNYGLSASDVLIQLYLKWIPKYHGNNTEIQILSPMTRGSLGTANLNRLVQQHANPSNQGKRQIKIGEKIFREGDRVIHRRNNYDLNVFNGDIGKILRIDNEAVTCTVSFYPDGREVEYQKEDITEIDLAYAITIHKSQGSEFKVVIIPVVSQHFTMLYRNLIYTGLTRAKTLAIFVGTRRALATAIHQKDCSQRQTALATLINER
ncbi:MAG: exodeoxyribonuclease V alpha subunit [Lentisphaeria bacterium]|jgi:exodeoxyribonuclease V alpha subunit